MDGDGLYDPTQGDHPDVPGDQAVFWVFNDLADIHSESGAMPIRLEVRALAYAYSGYGSIDTTTFYRYDLVYRGNTALHNTHLGLWVDADLGDSQDDLIGCDTTRHLGITYNGDAIDGPASPNYGIQPPITAVQMLKGPRRAIGFDTVLLGMTGFMYYRNNFSVLGYPQTPEDFYGYLQSTWKDGTPLTVGGIGYGGTVSTTHAFPAPPDQPLPGWSECAESLPPDDRHFLINAGPFLMYPGYRSSIHFAVLWTRPSAQTGCAADFDALGAVADEVAAFFDTVVCQNGYRNLLSTGLIEPSAIAELRLTPQPSHAPTLDLVSVGRAGKPILLEVRDATGRLRATESATGTAHRFDGTDLPPGLHLVTIHRDGRLVGRAKWLVP